MFNFVEILSDTVKVGQKFVISGISSGEADNISINLSNGVDSNTEAALSIELNFCSNKVVVNKNVENDVALNRGDKFEFVIEIDCENFNIIYNGDSISEYKCEMSLDKIQSIIIQGDVDKLLKVNHLDAEYPNVAEMDENLAFESYIPLKYKPGHVIVISGKCSNEFFLMFTKNGTNRQMIHFNVRFDEEKVVMNTEDDVDCWTENEDQSEEFPFEMEKPFKMAFAFTDDTLKTAVDGTNFMNYKLDRIYIEEGEEIWDVLTGFRIMNRYEGTHTMITSVKHLKIDNSCEGFEQFTN